jgi:hypothetical protein
MTNYNQNNNRHSSKSVLPIVSKQCHYAGCHYAERNCADYHYAESNLADYHYAERNCADFQNAECHGTIKLEKFPYCIFFKTKSTEADLIR